MSGLTDGAVSELEFEALGARVEPYAAQPTVVLRLRITESSGTPVHAIALKCQIRIEPQRRTYEPAEEARLYDVFGPTPQWGDSLRPFLWTHTSAMVLAFTGSTEVDLPIVCSYDMEVAGHKYLHALDGGEVGLQLLFSGTVFAGAHRLLGPTGLVERGRDLPPAGAGVARGHGRVLPERRVGADEPFRVRRAVAVPVRARPARLGPDRRAAPQGGRPVTAGGDRFAGARSVADAVLYEGYVLYPYRASAAKNQLRWQFGVLVPPAVSAADPSERSWCRTECIVDPGQDARLTVRVRFLHVQHRSVEALAPDGESFLPVEALEVDGIRWMEWDEAVEREIDLEPVAAPPAWTGPRRRSRSGSPEARRSRLSWTRAVCSRGRVVRVREALEGEVRVHGSWADGPGAYVKVAVSVGNTTGCAAPGGVRDHVTRRSLVAVHTLLAVDDGAFVSLLDPPPAAAEAADGCTSVGTYPVLVGDGSADDVVLSSPIILYDHPAVAPESQGDMCDATEIDEILALRVLTLTDEEKAEARGTDARAAAIVDRWEDMPPEVWERLHGTVRSIGPAVTARPEPEPVPWWEPAVDAEVDPWSDALRIGDVDVAKGTRVRLRPSRRADAHDMFVAGMDATVAGVFHDVDGELHVAVTVDDDPASTELDWQGRYLFFHPDEIEVRA